MKHYTELVDEAVGFELYKHRTLRTCFDPASHEWTESTMEKKIEILKKLIIQGHSLAIIIRDYKAYYSELKKPYVADRVEEGLIEILQQAITIKS